MVRFRPPQWTSPRHRGCSVRGRYRAALPEDSNAFLWLHKGENGRTWLALLGDGDQLLSCQAIIKQYRLEQDIGQHLYNSAR